MMYEPGQLILYGSSGVYRVDALAPLEHITGCDPDKPYYQLSSLHRRERIYAPVDTAVFMRPLIGRRDAELLLEKAGTILGEAFVSSDSKAIREHYHQMLESHDCEQLIGLIQSVNAKERLSAKARKHMGKIDQEYKKKAEELVCEELSAAFDTPMENARTMLHDALQPAPVNEKSLA
jgi:CarD family transcriptional regulator